MTIVDYYSTTTTTTTISTTLGDHSRLCRVPNRPPIKEKPLTIASTRFYSPAVIRTTNEQSNH